MKIEELIQNKDSTCTGCHACYSICPKQAISMKQNNEGFLYPIINKIKCVKCKACDNVCPAINPIINNNNDLPKAYAAINNNEEVRLNSSSGGIFTALAQIIIEQEGIVFGAKFADDFSVIHTWTDTLEGLQAFQGSKYVQSVIGNSYKECKFFLAQDKKVLFSGTPCQIQGLKKYLQKDYENLITVDFICHGVPSNLLWQKYIEYREKKSASQTVQTAFRRKNNGWKQFELSFSFANDSSYCSCHRQDPYMKIFLNDIALRKSCYKCPVRFINRPSDITIADFWGIQEIIQKMDDDKGTSFLIAHNKQAIFLINNLTSNCTLQEVNINSGIKHNSAIIKSPKTPNMRNGFYNNLEIKPFEKVYKNFQFQQLIIWIYKLPYRIIKKIMRYLIK